ncbi:hypothetical protein Tco_1251363 [Tanacetum coccineum]
MDLEEVSSIYSPSRAVLIPVPAILVLRSSALPCKVSQLMAVETLHLGLVIFSCVTPIDSDLSTSFLEKPSCPHANCHFKFISSKSSSWICSRSSCTS